MRWRPGRQAALQAAEIGGERRDLVGRQLSRNGLHDRVVARLLAVLIHDLDEAVVRQADDRRDAARVLTADLMGNAVERIYDVGVAGIHRLLNQVDRLQQARVVVVVAGMDGALPSVVGGLVSVPVIAVPTSVGYGTSFGGVAALLTMLNSCASGVAVVNIDNGFGAGVLASRINQLEHGHGC